MTVPDGAADAGAPDWVHLLPAGEIRTQDGRGPYTVTSMHAIAAGLKAGDKLPIDECHAIDRAAPLGQPAPARGWITHLEARDDGLWGKVEWTAHGQQLMADKAYRGISPVILHGKDNVVHAVLRASLINTPNLVGLASLHAENQTMDWKAKLIELLGLDSEADDAAIDAALSAKMATTVAPQGQQIDVFADPRFVALQGELATATTELATLKGDRTRDAASAFVDGAIAEGRIGVKPLREDYISMHMENPARAEKLIAGLPKLGGTTHGAEVPPPADDSGLTAAHRTVIALMGLSEDEYKARLAADAKKTEAL